MWDPQEALFSSRRRLNSYILGARQAGIITALSLFYGILHFIHLLCMTSYYLTCGGMFVLALAHFSNTPRANPVANAWLGGFFLCAASAVLAFVAQHTRLDIHYPFLVPLSESIRLLMAPSLYLAVLYLRLPGVTSNRQTTCIFYRPCYFYRCYSSEVHIYPGF